MGTKKVKSYEDAWKIQQEYDGPHGWIQWKGTSVCMDVHCACGEIAHIDAEFAYQVKCESCGRVYFCNGNIELIEIESPSNEMPEVVVASA